MSMTSSGLMARCSLLMAVIFHYLRPSLNGPPGSFAPAHSESLRRAGPHPAAPQRDDRRLGAGADPQLAEHVIQVKLDRARADDQYLGDLLVGHPGGHPCQHF